MKVYNFSAGPAMLPEDVMKIAQAEFCDFKESGSGLIELSHRGKQFTEVIDRAVANVRELMNISDDYAVLFVQGGASLQFSMLAMNLLQPGKTADYADTGVWSNKAYKEAANLGSARIVCSSKEDKYSYIPEFAKWEATPADAAYLHITSNNTVAGTQYRTFPKVDGVPLIADMSSGAGMEILFAKSEKQAHNETEQERQYDFQKRLQDDGGNADGRAQRLGNAEGNGKDHETDCVVKRYDGKKDVGNGTLCLILLNNHQRGGGSRCRCNGGKNDSGGE